MSWTVRVTIKFKSEKVMEWCVSGASRNDSICDFVSESPEWGAFLRWREGVPKNEWGRILIEQTMLADKK
jgi:hypothetical protein